MFRVKLLSAGRLASLALFIAIAAALAIYLTTRNRKAEGDEGRPKLQGRVVAIFNNTRYAHEVEGRIRFVLTAGTDKTYEDGTHELEQVKLESFGADGARHDTITSDSAQVSDTSNLGKLDAEFINNVVVQTSDGMTVKTSYLHYDQAKNTVDTDRPVEFAGDTLEGKCTGLIIEITDERARLLADVDLTIKPEGKSEKQAAGEKNKTGKTEDKTADKAARKAARKARKRARKLEKERRAQLAGAREESGKLAGKDGRKPANVASLASKEPTRVRCASAMLEKKEGRVTFTNNVIITKGADEMRSDRMVGLINDEKRIERIEARGNAHLVQKGRAEISSADMDFFFGEANLLVRAVAMGGAYTRSLGSGPAREARAATIDAAFGDSPAGNVVETINATGDAVINIHAPANAKGNPAARELRANAVMLKFFPDGQNIETAEAVENAVITVTPVRAEAGAEKKIISAPRMDGLFYEQDGRLKTFNASGGVKVHMEPLLAGSRPPRITSSQTLRADFNTDSQDVDRLVQEGDFKYAEGDRNAEAERATYNGAKEFLSLRGSRPMAWDSKARTQADEIDYDRRADESFARGDVRTTYYSRETTNNSTPFSNTKSPVFITAEQAHARNSEGIAVYTGNARGWQDDNFVKGDRIELYQKEKRMVATGNVQSALYNTRKEVSPGKTEPTPGFASADRMTYSDTERLIHYEGSVKARQGTDRIEAEKVDVFMMAETNEVDRLFAEGKVVLVQPGRRGTGDKLAYTGSDGKAVLSGKTARVDDAQQGSTMGTQLTFNSRDDRISVENQQGAGRVRSTHRLKKQ
jgi:lipopolysaccharide export system protein LptA